MKGHVKILCPIDFSEASSTALDAAVTLAERIAAEVLLLHVVPPVPLPVAQGDQAPFDPAAYQRELEESAKEALRALAGREIPDHVDARSVVTSSADPAAEIAKLADRENTGMIVMATHGESGWECRTGGSVTIMVVRTASCPVMSVPVPDPSRCDTTTFLRVIGERTVGSEL